MIVIQNHLDLTDKQKSRHIGMSDRKSYIHIMPKNVRTRADVVFAGSLVGLIAAVGLLYIDVTGVSYLHEVVLSAIIGALLFTGINLAFEVPEKLSKKVDRALLQHDVNPNARRYIAEMMDSVEDNVHVLLSLRNKLQGPRREYLDSILDETDRMLTIVMAGEQTYEFCRDFFTKNLHDVTETVRNYVKHRDISENTRIGEENRDKFTALMGQKVQALADQREKTINLITQELNISLDVLTREYTKRR